MDAFHFDDDDDGHVVSQWKLRSEWTCWKRRNIKVLLSVDVLAVSDRIYMNHEADGGERDGG